MTSHLSIDLRFELENLTKNILIRSKFHSCLLFILKKREKKKSQMAFLRLFEDTKTYQNSQPSAQGSFRSITLKLGKFTNVKVFFEWFQRIISDIIIIIIIIITIIRNRYYVQDR